MFICSNKKCLAQYSDADADALKGDCQRCGQPLANEQGLGWRALDKLRPKPPNPAQAGQLVPEGAPGYVYPGQPGYPVRYAGVPTTSAMPPATTPTPGAQPQVPVGARPTTGPVSPATTPTQVPASSPTPVPPGTGQVPSTQKPNTPDTLKNPPATPTPKPVPQTQTSPTNAPTASTPVKPTP